MPEGKMKKILLITLFAITLFSFSSSSAQIKTEATVLTLNLGIVSLSDLDTGADITGYSFNTTLEKYYRNTGWSFGMNIGFNRGEDVVTTSASVKTYSTLKSTTLFITGKYSFQKSSNIIPYIGIGFGWSFSNKETAFTDLISVGGPSSGYYETSLTGYMIAAPLGVNFYLSPEVFLGLNIAPFYSENSFYKDDFNWAFNFSLGFQF